MGDIMKVGSWCRPQDREKAVAALGRKLFGIAGEQKERDAGQVGVGEHGGGKRGWQGGVTGLIEELGRTSSYFRRMITSYSNIVQFVMF